MDGLGQFLRVDLTHRVAEASPYPEEWADDFLAGRGVNAYLLCRDLDSEADPLGPENILLFSCGLLTGSHAPASSRLHVNAKSPLTGGFGSSNVGGELGARLASAGIRSMMFTGRSDSPVWLHMEGGKAEFREAADLWGKDTRETRRIIQDRLGGSDLEVALIGPGGEHRVRFASIMTGHGHTAGRTGMGAVMGSKNLKAISVRAPKLKAGSSPEAKQAVAEYHKTILDSPRYKLFAEMSNTFVVGWANDIGILPTRNYRRPTFAGAPRIDGRDMLRHVVKRRSCHRCPVHCRAEFRIRDGVFAGASGERPDLEPIMSLGAKCGLDDSDAILYLHNLCNRLGIDSLSAGSVIAFAMEAYEKGDLKPGDAGGVAPVWGDWRVIETLIRQISMREGLGNILAEGVHRAAKRIGGAAGGYAYHSKGLELTGFDPRGLKATALGYAISTRGGDFTSVYALPEIRWTPERCRTLFGSEKAADRLSIEGKGRMVRLSAIVSAVLDSLGICKVPALSLICEFDLKREAQLVSLLAGRRTEPEALFEIGERIINTENLFNIRHAPWRPKESLPEMFRVAPIDGGPSHGQVVEIDSLTADFHQEMDWDPAGVPRCGKLEDLNILSLSRPGECV